jgi:cysteinyl-tRNA synthetase
MDRSQASALVDLQMHWDEAYVISLDGNIWSARYRTSAEELRAHTSTELRELIRTDYAYRQKADLVAYDPDQDDEFGDDDGANDDDEAAASDSETGQDGDREQHRDASANFAAIHGERMSI